MKTYTNKAIVLGDSGNGLGITVLWEDGGLRPFLYLIPVRRQTYSVDIFLNDGSFLERMLNLLMNY